MRSPPEIFYLPSDKSLVLDGPIEAAAKGEPAEERGGPGAWSVEGPLPRHCDSRVHG